MNNQFVEQEYVARLEIVFDLVTFKYLHHCG